MELFADFADLAVGESEALLETRTTVVLTYRVFVALLVVLDPDAFEVAVFENSVFHEIIAVKPSDALKRVVVVFSNADDPIFLQDEAVALSLIEALLIAEQPLVSEVDNHGLIPRNLLFFPSRSRRILHEAHEELFKRVHILRKVLGQHLEDLSIFDRLLVDDFLQLIVDELADHDHIILDNHCLSVQLILSEHPENRPLSAFLFPLRFHPQDVVPVQSVVLHRSERSYRICDVDVLPLDGVLAPLGWVMTKHTE